MRTESFELGNLCCVSCAEEVELVLRSNPHIDTARIDYLHDRAIVTYEEDALNANEIAELINLSGHGCAVAAPSPGSSFIVAGASDGTDSFAGRAHPLHAVKSEAAVETAQALPDGGPAHSTNTTGATTRMAHMGHQMQMATISLGTKMDRMQYEMPATAARHTHRQMQAEDVAIQIADIVLMKSDPLDILRAVRLSKATVTKMKQNLFWASIYNVLAIPVAAGLLYPSLGLSIRPEFSALLMSASSIIVATNAVLLKRVEPELREV